MHMSDFARLCLIFSNTYLLIAIMILGLLTKKRQEVYWGIMCLCLSIMINYALKVTFKVPLLFKVGYAFPSGHMQLVTFFYGWLALIGLFRMQYWVWFIGLAQAYGQIYFHYHNGLETFSGFAEGVLLLSIFYSLYFNQFKYLVLLLLSFAGLLLMYIFFRVGAVPNYVSFACVAFVSLILFYQRFKKFLS